MVWSSPLLDQSLLVFAWVATNEFRFGNKISSQWAFLHVVGSSKRMMCFVLLKSACFAELAGLNGEFCINYDRDVWKHQMNILEKQSETWLSWFQTQSLQLWCEAVLFLIGNPHKENTRCSRCRARGPRVDEERKKVLWWLSCRPHEAIIICLTVQLSDSKDASQEGWKYHQISESSPITSRVCNQQHSQTWLDLLF